MTSSHNMHPRVAAHAAERVAEILDICADERGGRVDVVLSLLADVIENEELVEAYDPVSAACASEVRRVARLHAIVRSAAPAIGVERAVELARNVLAAFEERLLQGSPADLEADLRQVAYSMVMRRFRTQRSRAASWESVDAVAAYAELPNDAVTGDEKIPLTGLAALDAQHDSASRVLFARQLSRVIAHVACSM